MLAHSLGSRFGGARFTRDDLQVPRWWPMHWGRGVYAPYGTDATTRKRPKPHLHQVEHGNGADKIRFWNYMHGGKEKQSILSDKWHRLDVLRTVLDRFGYTDIEGYRKANK